MLHHYPQIPSLHPSIHHPPIAQPIHPSIHSIQSQLYPHPAHSLLPHPHPQPHPHPHSHPHPSQHSAQPLLPIVSASYLPSATSLYANLLQPLSIKLLNPFPHAQHQIQTQTSTFGLSNVYPDHPLFSLSQSPPHLPLRPAQLTLSAPSQQALHEFMSQCELHLPGSRGHIEQIENGESCTVRDMDGNLVEVYWSTHNSRINSLYAHPSAPPRISHPPRTVESAPAFSPLRERERELDRPQPYPPQRERNTDRERNNKVREDRRIDPAQGNKRSVLPNPPYEAENRPTRENRRVLQWQQDVVNSTRDRDESYNTENPEETEELERSDDYGYPEDIEPPPNNFASHKHSNQNHHEHWEKRNTSEPYQETYQRADNYQIREKGEGFLSSHERRKETKRQKEKYIYEPRRNSYVTRVERTPKKTNLSPRSNPNFGLLATDQAKIDSGRRRARSFSGSISPSPTDFNRLNLDGPELLQNQYDHYNEHTRRGKRLESEPSRRKSGRRRDSGIGGMKISDPDRANSDYIPVQRYRSEGTSKSRIPSQREARHVRKRSETSNTNRDSHSRRQRGKELERITESRHRYTCSQSDSDDVSEISYNSVSESLSEFESEPSFRPESSHRYRERKQVRGRLNEEIENQHQVKDLERVYKDNSASSRHEHYSKKHSRRGKSRGHDNKSSSQYLSGIPVITQCPSSNSGPSMGAEKHILVQVPTPPSALPKHSQRRERRKMPVNEERDDFSEDLDSFGENHYDRGTRDWTDKQATPHATSRHRSFDMGQASGDAIPHKSSRRREQSRAPRHRYDSSPDPSETSSSVDEQRDRVRERKGKGRRSTRY